jgi:hypothetical protein
MISTDLKVSSGHEVPATWVFKHFCGIKEELTGQRIKMLSMFKAEKTPSMFVYFSVELNTYVFKCFSTGYSGGPLKLVAYLMDVTTYDACNFIAQEYNKPTVRKAKDYNIVPDERYKVSYVEIRPWVYTDFEYWKSYGVDSDTLSEFNVRPIRSYRMAKEGQEITIVGECIYGFYRDDGELIKIYQPKQKKRKFIRVSDYMQGYDQLQFVMPTLIITSSMKEVICLHILGVPAEFIAPNSESTIIDPIQMEYYKESYRKILVLFDNDEAGRKGALKYWEQYGIEMVDFTLDKDVSDAIKNKGLNNTRLHLIEALKGKL